MVVIPCLPSPIPEPLFAQHDILCELGARPNSVYLARQTAPEKDKAVLLVAQCFSGANKPGYGKGAEFLREAQRIATLTSPNVARVRSVVARGDDVLAFGEFLDGEKLAEVWCKSPMPLEIALRFVLDVLSGVSALQNLRDSQQRPMNLVHGEVSPSTIVLGLDGIARVLDAIARRAPSARAEAASNGYLAPEVLAGKPWDARADVFSAGVLLWEALSGKRLFPEGDTAATALRDRDAILPPAIVPAGTAWARGLAVIAAKAVAAQPEARWSSAAAMAAELRKVVGLKLAPLATACAFAQTAIADPVKVRRERFERMWIQYDVSHKRPFGVRPAADPTAEPLLEGHSAAVPSSHEVSIAPAAVAASSPPMPPPLPTPASRSTQAGSHSPPPSADAMAAFVGTPVADLPPPNNLVVKEEPETEIDAIEEVPHRARRRAFVLLIGLGGLSALVLALAGLRIVQRGAPAPAPAVSFAVKTMSSPGTFPPISSAPSQLSQTATIRPVPARPASLSLSAPLGGATTTTKTPSEPASVVAPAALPQRQAVEALRPAAAGQSKPRPAHPFDPNFL
jgi:hypothetical protein